MIFNMPAIVSPCRRFLPPGRRLWPGSFLLIGIFLAVLAPLSPAFAEPCALPQDALASLAKASVDQFFDAAATRDFYDKWGASCAWNDKSAQLLLARISRADEEGVDPGIFASAVAALHKPPKDTPSARVRDLMLTDLALRYARIMSFGQTDLSRVDSDIYFPRRKADLSLGLATALSYGNIREWLQSLGPRNAAYERLKDMLARYRIIREKGGWALTPPGPTPKPGEENPYMPELRRRLMAEDDLGSSADGTAFDDKTVEALKHFQARHGLTPDGLLGKKTRLALNIPVETRIDQIIANLDRWRYLGPVLPATRFEVNAAAGDAQLIVGERAILTMRAIAGKPENPTPMLLSAINEVIVNPTWTIPWSIVRNEIPTRLRHDPQYLARNKMRWIRGWLVQAAGIDNPLGRLKFNFPNPFSVYLHDTPAVNLFDRDDRARSHGCVRLELPLELAEYLLKDNPEWPKPVLEEAIAAPKTIRIPLETELPVAILYWTAFAGNDGIFEFREDIYGRDTRLIQALPQLNTRPLVP
jgi:murein L,D-transpeptidase YcbB/YkuD